MVRKTKEPPVQEAAPPKRGRSLTEDLARVADGVGRKAVGSWDKLEQVFEDRVARALAAIGVPTRGDLDALTRQVEQLSRKVAELSGAPAGAARAPAKRPLTGKVARTAVAKPAAKAAAKKAAPRKAAARKTGPA